MTSPRTDWVYGRACGFIVSQRIDRLPVEPTRIIARNGWGLVTYERLAELDGIPPAAVASLCRSGDGFTIFNGRNYCIAYNSTGHTFGRVVFTLMHEIGHITLGHLSRPDSDALSGDGNDTLEREADYFAGCVLAPSVVIERCGLKNPAQLSAACGLSHQAAVRRLEQHRLWRKVPADEPVNRLLDAYIKTNMAVRCNMRAAEIVRDESGASR